MSRPYYQHALVALFAIILGGMIVQPARADGPRPSGTARANTGSTATDVEQDRLRDLARRLANDDDDRARATQQSSSSSANAPAKSSSSPAPPDQPAAPANRADSPRPSQSAAAPPRPSHDESTTNATNADKPLGPRGDHAGKSNWFLGQDGADASTDTGNTSDRNDGTSDGFTGGSSWVLETLMALGVVIALILLLRWAWLRLSGQPHATASTPVVEVLSRTTIAPRNHVLLLRVGHRILIVSDGSSGMRTLASIEDEQEVADLLTAVTAAKDTSISRNFQQLLGRFGASHDQMVWDGEEDGRDSSEHLFDRARNNVSGLASRIRTLSSQKGGDQ